MLWKTPSRAALAVGRGFPVFIQSLLILSLVGASLLPTRASGAGFTASSSFTRPNDVAKNIQEGGGSAPSLKKIPPPSRRLSLTVAPVQGKTLRVELANEVETVPTALGTYTFIINSLGVEQPLDHVLSGNVFLGMAFGFGIPHGLGTSGGALVSDLSAGSTLTGNSGLALFITYRTIKVLNAGVNGFTTSVLIGVKVAAFR